MRTASSSSSTLRLWVWWERLCSPNLQIYWGTNEPTCLPLSNFYVGNPEGQPIDYLFIGDDSFALMSWMMKPYPWCNLNKPEEIFNYRLSRAYRVLKNAFGMLANRQPLTSYAFLNMSTDQTISQEHLFIKLIFLLLFGIWLFYNLIITPMAFRSFNWSSFGRRTFLHHQRHQPSSCMHYLDVQRKHTLAYLGRG